MKGFYSPVDKLAAELPRTKGTGAEFMTELSKRPGYKPQEAQDRDLQALMALPKMAREEFLAQLKAKPAPELQESTLDKYSDEPTKYREYTLPGGRNYREILLQMPHDEQRAKEFADPASSHWDVPNVLAHVRAKDRTGPNGEKLLHIEEIQSDWHQKGREHGYATPESLKEFRAAELRHKLLKRQLDEAKAQSESAENSLKRKEPLFQQPDVRERYEAARVKANNDLMDLMPQVMKAQAEVQDFGHKMNSMVPNAPFKKNWHEMALKKMIHHAAENGYHGIVITPGLEQAKRYNLAKHISGLQYDPEQKHLIAAGHNGEAINKIVEPHELPDYLGKEITEKLLNTLPLQGRHHLTGINLQTGGEGMTGFYDKMVPSFLNQFGKKYGAQVQPGSVSIVSTPAQHHGLTESQFQAQSPDEQQRMVRQHAYAHQGAKTEVPVHYFPITPEMREDVTKNGVPLYAEGGDVKPKAERDANLAEFLKDSVVKDRMYHATKNKFNAFKPNFEGTFLTPNTKFANEFAINYAEDPVGEEGPHGLLGVQQPYIAPVHVQVKNPFDYQNPEHREILKKAAKKHHGTEKMTPWIDKLDRGHNFEHMEHSAILEPLKKAGFDSYYVSENGNKNLAVFDPRKIKSAIGNRGTYDLNNPDITKAKGGSIKPVGYTKEKVTVSPDLDQMRYELISVKHSKKVK